MFRKSDRVNLHTNEIVSRHQLRILEERISLVIKPRDPAVYRLSFQNVKKGHHWSLSPKSVALSLCGCHLAFGSFFVRITLSYAKPYWKRASFQQISCGSARDT